MSINSNGCAAYRDSVSFDDSDPPEINRMAGSVGSVGSMADVKSGLNMQQLLLNFEENEPIFENELLYPTPTESEILHFDDNNKLMYGTVEALITYITSPHILNYQFLVDFFLTFRSYIQPLPLLELLLCRLSWCLKKSLDKSDKEKALVGKLTLIRTFVTIRHWLLNHFHDDFINDSMLRTLFATTINELGKHKKYVGDDCHNLQLKTIRDLKKTYIALVSLYWDVDNEMHNDLSDYDISSYQGLDATRLSMVGLNNLNDPSTRRLSVLSMLDNTSASNPLQSYLKKDSNQQYLKKDTNSFLYPKDSLNSLNIKKQDDMSTSPSIDLLYNTIIDKTPISGFVSLDNKKHFKGGFTTKGNIEISQDSKIRQIHPITKELSNEKTEPPIYKSNKNIVEKNTQVISRSASVKAKKRSFIKSIFGQSEKENGPQSLDYLIPQRDRKDEVQRTRSNVQQKQEKTIKENHHQDMIHNLEKQVLIKESSLDYLEEIVINEYQDMLQHPSFKHRYSKKLRGINRKSVLSIPMDLSMILIVSDNQPEKSMNLDRGDANHPSFSTPIDTFDWSDSNNLIETDNGNQVFVDMGVTTADLDNALNDGDIHMTVDDKLQMERQSFQHFETKRFSQIPLKNKHLSDSRLLRHRHRKSLKNMSRKIEPLLSNPQQQQQAYFNETISVNNIKRQSVLSTKSRELKNLNTEVTLRKKNAISNLRVEVGNDSNISEEFNDTELMDNTIHDQRQLGEILDSAGDLFGKPVNSILDAFLELPFNNDFGDAVRITSNISILPSPTPSQTYYNGLSQADINELAAIPDEKVMFQVIVGLNDADSNIHNKLDEEEIHRKHALAVVCESPTKAKDMIHDNIENTLNDQFHRNDSDVSDESKVEKQVRDLYIVNNSTSDSLQRTSVHSKATLGSKLEMSCYSAKMKETGSILSRVSTGKLLKNDAEKSNFELQSLMVTPQALNSREHGITVEDVLNENLHIPFIFKYDCDQIATQMTLIERDILLELEWRELINLKWDQPLRPYNSWLKLILDSKNKSGLELITLRFNLVNNWIISEILLCKDINLRVLTITRFIQLADKCRRIQNYGTLFQIMLALNSEVLRQLKSTWIRIDPITILRFKDLKDLTSPNNNFKCYRDEVTSVIPSKGFIPFLPLALSDLTMYSEMPTFVSSKHKDIDLDSLAEFDASSEIDYQLVNFEKFRVTGETVKNTIRHIEWSKFYELETNKEILSRCLYISSLSEEDMSLCLKQIELNPASPTF
ncbi:hypothetical protein CAS74_002922 [Pichia kudriavzevii]|uniref:Guanine nucleotide exchange factor LTE1 n=1 Tax=Pichia kudriavzevii TaxID=4909 RepID=A0A1Z8JMW5_PICKU|nr:hypothetical protein CAS74_002922 [Pichia kudriavzevii]